MEIVEEIIINGRKVEPMCYNCGKKFGYKDNSFTVLWDPGFPETHVEPEVEPEFYIECEECTKGRLVKEAAEKVKAEESWREFVERVNAARG